MLTYGHSLYRVVGFGKSVVDESDWYRVNITVNGKHITVELNGRQVVDYTEPANPERHKNHEGKVLKPKGGGIAL